MTQIISPKYEMLPTIFSDEVPIYLKRILKKQGFDIYKQNWVLDFCNPVQDKSFIRWPNLMDCPFIHVKIYICSF